MVAFYTDSKEPAEFPLKRLHWTLLGLTGAAKLGSEILVRCIVPCTEATSHPSTPTIAILANFTFQFTMVPLMVLRVLLQSYLKKYHDAYIRQVVDGALAASVLLLQLLANQRARAHVAHRLRNRLAGLGLEPGLGWPCPCSCPCPALPLPLPLPGLAQSRLVAVAIVGLNGNTAR
jgi:hypothetical protein